MTTRAIERVDQWETRSFGGGYRGLQELTGQDFSGVVRSPAGTLCMLNGTVIGVLNGTIEDFEAADGTAYEAPTAALPLLIVMQDRGDEVRAKYYTEETPLSKVDSTLSDGGFTGYIELSENVLSGDYYVVYHSGRSMSVAFVGNSGQLLSDEEAFERADDEVGIYKVRAVDIDPIEIPDSEPQATAASDASDVTGQDHSTTTADGTTTDSAEEPADNATEKRPADTDEPTTEATQPDAGESHGAATNDTAVAEPDADEGAVAAEETTPESTDEPDGEATADEGHRDATEQTTASTSHGSEAKRAATREREGADTARSDGPATAGTTTTRKETERTGEKTGKRKSAAEGVAGTEERSRERDRSGTGVTVDEKEVDSAEREREPTADRRPEPSTGDRSTESQTVGGSAQGSETGSAADLETRTIPSLDPDRTRTESTDRPSGPATAAATQSVSRSKSKPSDEPRPRSSGADGSTETSRERADTGSTTEPPGAEPAATEDTPTRTEDSDRVNATDETDDRVRELEETIDEREERIDDLETHLESVREECEEIAAERDDIRAERDELIDERDELKAELERVREELADLREQRDSLQTRLEDVDADGVAAETRLSRTEAMDGTDLFVRYDSKGEPTLKTAHDSGASRSDVNANLNVEYHTQFEADGAVVAGQPFDAFLQDTLEFRFVSWLLRQLPFEIRDTGHHKALSDLYDALPRIDRAELNGEATVEYTEEGQTKRTQEAFDVVLRDRMGNPLVVANFNDTREAATEDDMRSLVTSATRVGESNDSLAGAMYVTASFFEPAALETASESTGGGLLSRDKRESYVKVSRKRGYHLCLVEARDEQFHMAVPEL
ncbi:DUF7527 domain-containing protein [Halorhabdus amylolytica]|uniref:DUF7527 domain-containing protein n=1 Tax=Halorhabdus amylolytica TaxID=2559573 RepID=UPI0010AB455B|nr:hypothetical protein [Halorhabdus amylolytica]